MKKLVTLVMIAAATTFAMTSCGGGEDAANAWADAMTESLEEAAEEMEEAIEEVEEVVEEEVVMDDTTATDDAIEITEEEITE